MRKIYALLFVIFSLSCFAQFPAFTVSASPNAPAGYYFTAPYRFTSSYAYQFVYDGAGNVVYYKAFPAARTYDFKVHANGMMSYYRQGSGFLLMDSTFTVVDTIRAAGYPTDLHELQILPNGNYLLLAYEYDTLDLSGYNYFNLNSSPGNDTASVKSNIIQELDSNKNVVFEWHSKDHLPFDEVDQFWLNNPSNVDWSHSNAVELDSDGNYLLCSRHFNEITKINKSTGAVMWHFGGKYNDFTFTADTVPFYGQHDIRRLSNGRITLYDNGRHFVSHGARAVEYVLDETAKTAELVWSFKHDSLMNSTSQGSFGRFNEYALINFGTVTKDSICFMMVDTAGSELLRLKFNNGLFSYRSYFYPELPWTFKRPQPICFDSLGTTYLKLDSTFASYLWQDGGTSSITAITDTGKYFVFVPYGQNGYIASEIVHVSDMADVCGPTLSLPEDNLKQGTFVYPNPAQNVLNVTLENTDKNCRPYISDVFGKTISASYTENSDGAGFSFDISGLSGGMYFLVIKNRTHKFIKQ